MWLTINKKKNKLSNNLIRCTHNRAFIVWNHKLKDKKIHQKVNHRKIVSQTNLEFFKNKNKLKSHFCWVLLAQIQKKTSYIIIRMMKFLLIVLIHHPNLKYKRRIHIRISRKKKFWIAIIITIRKNNYKLKLMTIFSFSIKGLIIILTHHRQRIHEFLI